MAIHQRIYAPWQGDPLSRPHRILAIAGVNARIAFTNLWTIIFLVLCFLVIGGFFFVLFLMTILPREVPMDKVIPQFLSNNVYRTYLTDGFLLLLYALLGAAAGAGALSRDLRANAIPIYLSRPITKLDYILGKAAAFIAFLLAATLAPAIILWIGAWAAGVEEIGWGSRLLDLAGIVLTSLLVVVPMAACVLAFSSLTRRTALAGVYWILFFLGTFTMAAVLEETTNDKFYGLLDWSHNLKTVAAAFFETRVKMPAIDAGHGIFESALILAGLTAAAVAILWARLRTFEEV